MIAIGLSMDSFAVSICGSMSLTPTSRLLGSIKFGLWFGIFQGLMPILGYYGLVFFRSYMEEFDHWVAFFLLAYIGFDMLLEAYKTRNSHEVLQINTSNKRMFSLAVATSIDALAVGASFAMLDVEIWSASLTIGVVTFFMSTIGGFFGFKLGERFSKEATIAGGIVLLLIAFKILFEHIR